MGDALRDNYECLNIANQYEHKEGECVTCLKKRLRALEHQVVDLRAELDRFTKSAVSIDSFHKGNGL